MSSTHFPLWFWVSIGLIPMIVLFLLVRRPPRRVPTTSDGFDAGSFFDANPVICLVDVRGYAVRQKQVIDCYGKDLSASCLIILGIPDDALVRFVNSILKNSFAEIRQDDRNAVLRFAIRHEIDWLQEQLLESYQVTMPFVRPGVP